MNTDDFQQRHITESNTSNNTKNNNIFSSSFSINQTLATISIKHNKLLYKENEDIKRDKKDYNNDDTEKLKNDKCSEHKHNQKKEEKEKEKGIRHFIQNKSKTERASFGFGPNNSLNSLGDLRQVSDLTKQIHRQLLASLNANMAKHTALRLPGITAERLLLAWERFVILSDWARTSSAFSTADLIIMSLIFATIANIFASNKAFSKNQKSKDNPCKNSNGIKQKTADEEDKKIETEKKKMKKKIQEQKDVDQHNKDIAKEHKEDREDREDREDKEDENKNEETSFFDSYDILSALSPLTPIEIFYCSVIVTKMVVDIEETSFYGVSFNMFELQLLKDAVKDDDVLRKIRPRLHCRRFSCINRAIFALQLYVLDVKLPLGRKTIHMPPYANSDDKIQAYITVILKRVPIAEDYTLNASPDSVFSNECMAFSL